MSPGGGENLLPVAFVCMPRKPRDEFEGGVYHVFARGNARMQIFRGKADYRLYLELLRRIVRARGWTCHGYCLMPNHVHLVIETGEPNLGEGMQRLQSLYAQIFNLTRVRTGHVFEGRFGAVLIRNEAQLQAVVEYVARNPVEAGLAERVEDWPWSSSAVSPGLLVSG